MRTCLKCSHPNPASTGEDAEACPQCGAIYSKVAAAAAARQPQAGLAGGKRFPIVLVLLALLAVLIPLTIYEHTLGSSAKRRQAEASSRVARDRQRVEDAELAAERQRRAVESAISQGRLLVGMTSGQVRDAWGTPTSTNRSVAADKATEQWVYRRSGGKTAYVYLDNGIVRSYQTAE